MKLRRFLQLSEYNYDRDEYFKNQKKTAFLSQYSIYFPGKNTGVLYIIVSIKLHIGNDMDSGQYVCDILDYNTGT